MSTDAASTMTRLASAHAIKRFSMRASMLVTVRWHGRRERRQPHLICGAGYHAFTRANAVAYENATTVAFYGGNGQCVVQNDQPVCQYEINFRSPCQGGPRCVAGEFGAQCQ